MNQCQFCGSNRIEPLGILGNRICGRCRNCGMDAELHFDGEDFEALALEAA